MTVTSRQSVPKGSIDEHPAEPAPPMETPTTARSVTALVSDFHARILRLLHQGDGPGPADTHRAGGLDSAVSAMAAHMAVAESTLLPAAAQILDRDAMRAHRDRVSEVYRVMRRIQQSLWGDSQAGLANLDRLRASFERMIDANLAEELDLARALDEHLDEATRSDLIERYIRAQRKAPSRPHPHAVQTPLAHLAMTAAARWDRVLDTLDARVVPDRPREGAKTRPGRWGEYLLGTPNWPGRAEGPKEGSR
ncbi:MAG: hypothetical protein ACXV3F_06580 [Frankiaceae bacterium]